MAKTAHRTWRTRCFTTSNYQLAQITTLSLVEITIHFPNFGDRKKKITIFFPILLSVRPLFLEFWWLGKITTHFLLGSGMGKTIIRWFISFQEYIYMGKWGTNWPAALSLRNRVLTCPIFFLGMTYRFILSKRRTTRKFFFCISTFSMSFKKLLPNNIPP